jgi:hypothetical protein
MSRNQALVDVILVISVCAAYVLLEALHVPKRWSFLAMGLALIAFAGYLAKRRTDSWQALGFRTDNFKEALLPTVVITLAGAAGLVGFGIWRGRTAWGPEALLLL